MPPGDIDFRPILTCDRVLIARRGSAVLKGGPRARKLAKEAFVLPRKGSTTRTMIEGAFAQAGLELRVAVEAGGWEIVKRYVAMGLGVSVVPDFVIRPGDRKALGARSVKRLRPGDLRHHDAIGPYRASGSRGARRSPSFPKNLTGLSPHSPPGAYHPFGQSRRSGWPPPWSPPDSCTQS